MVRCLTHHKIKGEFMSEENELKLNDEAQKALFKANIKYYLVNGIIFLIMLVIVCCVYCYTNHLDLTTQIAWKILKSPKFLIPAIVLIFVKDTLKFIFFGMSKEENKYLEEAEKENPKADGVKDVISGKSVKERFVFISALFGIIIFLLLFLIKRLFNIITIISVLFAYYYTAKHFSIPYTDYHNIILTKYFLLIFFIAYVILSTIKKTFKKEEKNENAEDNVIKVEDKDDKKG